MDLTIASANKGAAKKVSVSDAIFASEYNEPLIHQVVTAYLAGARAGTKAQKNRSAVSGGGAKPWKQKGTGRARAGTIRSPIWVGGGRTFAAKPRDFSQKVNKKMHKAAMRSLLSELVRQSRLQIVEPFQFDAPKTKAMTDFLKGLSLDNALFVFEDFDANVFLSARNVPNIEVMTINEVDPVSLVRFDNVLMTEGAAKRFEELLA